MLRPRVWGDPTQGNVVWTVLRPRNRAFKSCDFLDLRLNSLLFLNFEAFNNSELLPFCREGKP